jgi:outer membrane protein W
MKKIPILVLLCTLAFPAHARWLDLTAWYSRVDLSGDPAVEDLRFNDIDFDSSGGFGLGVNFFVGNRFSIQLAAYRFDPEAAMTADDPLVEVGGLGELEVIPLTAVLQIHLLPGSRISPYVGAGVGYVILDDVRSSRDVQNVDVDRIDFSSDFGLVFNAGASFALSRIFALNLDVKYMPVDSAATVVFTQGPPLKTDVEVNPLIISAGLSLRF